MGKWSFDFFKRLPHCEVVVNDRAPARHADESSGGRQRSLPVSLSAYLQYVQASLTASTLELQDELRLRRALGCVLVGCGVLHF